MTSSMYSHVSVAMTLEHRRIFHALRYTRIVSNKTVRHVYYCFLHCLPFPLFFSVRSTSLVPAAAPALPRLHSLASATTVMHATRHQDSVTCC
jgi:hypothetical protein